MSKQSNGGIGRGYYIALILCAAAIGITGYVYDRNQSARPVSQTETLPADTAGADVSAIAIAPETAAPTQAATAPTRENTVLRTVAPVEGQTLAGYAMEALSYNQTTRDWRVHNGIDIAAEAGAPVAAAADGEVYTVYEDENLGHTVVIVHAGGYTTRYSCLGEDIAVRAGQTVTAGQVIGTVGQSALVETAMGPHVHFSVSCQDRPMDPEEFLAMGA